MVFKPSLSQVSSDDLNYDISDHFQTSEYVMEEGKIFIIYNHLKYFSKVRCCHSLDEDFGHNLRDENLAWGNRNETFEVPIADFLPHLETVSNNFREDLTCLSETRVDSQSYLTFHEHNNGNNEDIQIQVDNCVTFWFIS